MISYLTKERIVAEYSKVPVKEYANDVIKKMADPLVSVILITYQQKPFIAKALDAVLAQETTFPFEIILCDDDSTDGTREICIEYADRYPDKIRFFLHRRENNRKVLGKPSGIFQYTYSLLQARGKFIAICSGDDFWQDETKLEKQARFLVENPDHSLVYTSWVECTYDKNTDSFGPPSPLKSSFPKASTTMHVSFSKEIPVQFLDVIQEDVFSWFILEQKGRFGFLPDIRPTAITVLPESLSRSNTEKQLASHALNVPVKLIEAYKDSPYRKQARAKLLGTIRGLLNNPKYKPIRNWLITKSIFLFFRYNLFGVALQKKLNRY